MTERQKSKEDGLDMTGYNDWAQSYQSPYEQWKASQGLRTIRGLAVHDLFDEMDLDPWPARGGKGIFINMDGTGGFNDTYVMEIAPGSALTPIKHIYEETVFILKGNGATSVWLEGKPKQTFEWGPYSYFAIPPNAYYQHFNGSGSEPARYLAMTAAPRVIDTFKNLDFVFKNPFEFQDRFNGQDGYFVQTEKPSNGRWHTNFVHDVLTVQELATKVTGGGGRGGGALATAFSMVNSTVNSHTSSWPIGTYKKAHRHGPGIHVLILKGTGYSLMWLDDNEVHYIPWGPGSMFVPPEMWFHQHFNTGAEPVLFLAIGWGSDKPKFGGKAYVYKSVKEGGDQIEYEDEPPQLHLDFEAACAKSGVECTMGKFHPYCTKK